MKTTDDGEDLISTMYSLDGWADAIEKGYHGGPSQIRMAIGDVFSTLLLVTNEGENVVAVGGELDDAGVGYLAVVTTAGVVLLTSPHLNHEDASFTVALHPFSDVSGVNVRAHHSHIDWERRPRNSRMKVSFEVGGQAVLLEVMEYEPRRYRTGDAVQAAMKLLWER